MAVSALQAVVLGTAMYLVVISHCLPLKDNSRSVRQLYTVTVNAAVIGRTPSDHLTLLAKVLETSLPDDLLKFDYGSTFVVRLTLREAIKLAGKIN
ncbi:hypothetical protein CDL15_Pgr000270 [Punica granatum]|uniref:Uncharacterized protein n=1 Tax=Punica granatum TaxID=22663 RepID=A0A218Y377_PUNGR|nr:hypothetical protein CDL15_Pgr000270 [Punica granatum]